MPVPTIPLTAQNGRTQDPVAASFPIQKRNGTIVPFEGERIRAAIEKAFRAELDLDSGISLSEQVAQRIGRIAQEVVAWCDLQTTPLTVEQIQDEVERVLMADGEHRVARRYVLYREHHAKSRQASRLSYRRADGTEVEINPDDLQQRFVEMCQDLSPQISTAALVQETLKAAYHGITEAELTQAAIMAARARIEIEPDHTFVAARLLLMQLSQEVTGEFLPFSRLGEAARRHFSRLIREGLQAELLDEALLGYDLERLAGALVPERDLKFAYLGIQTLYDRYFLQNKGRRMELPQTFWMRVAMGLALHETDRNARAIEFYHLISQFHFTPATPTLFNSGTRHAQLSSCYLTTIDDDLETIFKCVKDNALLSKWAGGLGNDWTPVRALGADIKGTSGKSQGIIPFLKVANDTAIAVNQGGKRKGAVCAYLETWHLDIEEFLELRKNTGDDRRRTHDMNTANWIPDLFMERVQAGANWTLFSPNDTPDLHELYGSAFAARYGEYEQQADTGEITLFKRLPALDLWRKMLSMLFETGHPWMTWKDPSNLRSPQDHVGVVHNSNLCTEILLNNSGDETAVCNLGSVNLAAHITPDGLDVKKLEATIATAMRMLDNVIDLNFYPTPEARNANLRHRPVGLGIMGFQDALYALGLSYASEAAVRFADSSMEAISYFAIRASSALAAERGAYPTFAGSKWDRGLLPFDTLALVDSQRGQALAIDRSSVLDWTPVRDSIQRHGMRNSNTLAIAPTATISNIVGVTQSIEPTYKNLYVKSNLSGEFTQINTPLVAALKKRGLWDLDMLNEIKYCDGALGEIERIPEDLKAQFATAFEVAPEWLIECAVHRQKWIDMGQSLNLYLAQPSGKKLSDMYFRAWNKGLKTTYYLRTLAATQVEKSTLDINRFGIQPRWMKNKSASSDVQITRAADTAPKSCSFDGDCEACQ
jgi:ribonucleoside-diphosphate reductase alpha chain